MGSRVHHAETYHFRLGADRLTVYKRLGESYEHVLMKALGYALFRTAYPLMEVEKQIGLRYKPDLIALSQDGRPEFWGECGHVGLRKVVWLAKHSGARRIALFKFDIAARQFIAQVREEVAVRYRPADRLTLFNFDPVVLEEAGTEMTEIPEHWYEKHEI